MNFNQGKKVLRNSLTETQSQRYAKKRQDQQELIIDQNNGDTTDAVQSEEKTINYLKNVALFYDRVEKLTDNEKYEILKLWKPPEDFEFPVTVQGRRNGKFVHK